MIRILLLLAAFAATPSVAVAEKITIFNSTNSPIYKVFAWPETMNQRNFNILGFPLFPGLKTELSVDNTYGDCQFTFQYDVNDPSKLKLKQSKSYRKQPYGLANANICGTNIFVWLGPIPNAKVQGKP